jgi:hypothetical protein
LAMIRDAARARFPRSVRFTDMSVSIAIIILTSNKFRADCGAVAGAIP